MQLTIKSSVTGQYLRKAGEWVSSVYGFAQKHNTCTLKIILKHLKQDYTSADQSQHIRCLISHTFSGRTNSVIKILKKFDFIRKPQFHISNAR